MKIKIGLLMLLVSSLLLFGACRKSFEDRAEKFVDILDCKLDLTDEQLLSLNNIKDKIIKLKAEHKDEKEKFILDVKGLLVKEKVQESEVLDLVKRKRAHMDENTPKVLPDILAFHESLTREQKEKLVELLEKFKKKHARWH